MSIPSNDSVFSKYVSVDSILFENPQKEHSKLIYSLANKDDFHALQIKATYATSSQLKIVKSPSQPHRILNLSDEDSTNLIGQERWAKSSTQSISNIPLIPPNTTKPSLNFYRQYSARNTLTNQNHKESKIMESLYIKSNLRKRDSEFLDFSDLELNPGIIEAQGEIRSVSAITQGASKPVMVSKMVQVDFTDHNENIHDRKRYKCTLCDKKFIRPSSLKTHLFSHTGEKPYLCQVMGCRKRFSVLSNLRRHSKIHQTAG